MIRLKLLILCFVIMSFGCGKDVMKISDKPGISPFRLCQLALRGEAYTKRSVKTFGEHKGWTGIEISSPNLEITGMRLLDLNGTIRDEDCVVFGWLNHVIWNEHGVITQKHEYITHDNSKKGLHEMTISFQNNGDFRRISINNDTGEDKIEVYISSLGCIDSCYKYSRKEKSSNGLFTVDRTEKSVEYKCSNDKGMVNWNSVSH